MDPTSDLVSASELRVWRNQPTTQKVLRYLTRWRAQLVEALAEGMSLSESTGASAMKTTEFVSKAQILNDVLTLAPKDIADFYGLAEPQEKP